MTEQTAAGRGRVSLVVDWVIAAPFALLFAWDVWEGVGNLVGSLSLASGLESALAPQAWVALVLGIVAPLALFVGALLLARGRDPLSQLLLYLPALGLSAVLALDIVGLFGGLGSLLA